MHAEQILFSKFLIFCRSNLQKLKATFRHNYSVSGSSNIMQNDATISKFQNSFSSTDRNQLRFSCPLIELIHWWFYCSTFNVSLQMENKNMDECLICLTSHSCGKLCKVGLWICFSAKESDFDTCCIVTLHVENPERDSRTD